MSSQDRNMKQVIDQKLIKTGEKDRLKELLKQRLVDCGWRDELRTYCREVIKAKGLEKVGVDDLIAEITPVGREKVPESVKAELLQKIRKFLVDADN
ncbi:enhancer of yellow 2 transcription factor [Polychytrium aggregatum]|uniref:enhancer of yellow 2 transcription factor n=1 Tax=Polychytrium aggregatum TaxID=110093 RepID=UPI0022FF0834|nr:enhancer of yellow 2 transcription factor [Polychytrium aggregatum]KAI9203983.1 enhancer of yellow 2 transcription factor [Polychytrium aggregatum]